jgi:hypothetical protein
VLVNNECFWPALAKVTLLMREVGPRHIYISGTMPPQLMGKFCQRLALPCNIKVVRSRTTRNNLRFIYVDSHPTCAAVKRAIDKLKPGKKALVYVTRLQKGEELSTSLSCPFYSSEVEPQA